MLSIIIPIHNSEKYLKPCIESVIRQSYRNLEIILVENNSTDASKSICQEYAIKDNRIRLFCERNKGAASARNRGLREAQGEFITFVDSDDLLRENAYELIIPLMKKNGADLACYSFEYIDESGYPLNWYTPRLTKYKNKKNLNGRDMAKIFLTSKDIEGFGWNKIFKRSIFSENNIRFEETKTAFEDMAILFDALCYCKRAIIVPEQLYFYRQIDSSLSHQDYILKRAEYMDSIRHIVESASNIGLKKQAEIFVASRNVYSLYDALKNNRIEDYEFRQIVRDIFLILQGFKSEKAKMIVKALLILLNHKKEI